jgi:sugar phosphate isomerase/epimerase
MFQSEDRLEVIRPNSLSGVSSPTLVRDVTQPGIPNELVLSTSCYGARLTTIEDQAFAAVAMGFRRLEFGLSDHPPTMNGWADSHRETGIRVESIVAGALNPRSENMSGSKLGSTVSEERERALNSVRRHIRLAQSMQAPTIVVRGCEVEDKKLAAKAHELNQELDEASDLDKPDVCVKIAALVQKVQKKGQKQIEHFCRSLHTLQGEFPETRIAIEPGQHFNDLLNYEAVGWALDDLSRHNVGYWHDTGRIHQREISGLPTQGQWLDSYADRMMGCHLQDASAAEAEMPPGMGEVDFKLVSEYVPQGAAHVVEVNPRHGRAEVLGAVQFLLDLGF